MMIEHREYANKGEWCVEPVGQRLAEMTYSWAGDDKFIIDHTWVDDTLRGQRVGWHFVEQAVAFAREKGVKIIPLCPFAKSVFAKQQQWHDVLY